MKKFNPLLIIQKYRFLIIGVALLAGVVAAFLLNGRQSYTATAIIEYTNTRAKEGLAPDGTKIDTSEIYSTEVMKEAFTRMGLDYDSYNLDEFRSKVVVTPILTEEEQAVQEAINEQGEEAETSPTIYQVSLTLSQRDATNCSVFVRQLLDNMLDIFIEKYGEKHAAYGSFVNRLSEINEANYDYLEIVEVIDQSVEETISVLDNYVSGDVSFTSATNGFSFSDIYRQFRLIYSNEIPNIYAYILNNCVAKDKDVLISKYNNRIENYKIENESAQSMIDDIKEIIDSYVSMMRESGNTDITSEYILGQVYDEFYYNQETTVQSEDGQDVTLWNSADETVEYDVLLENYVKNRSSYEHALIDIAYCEYIVDLFSGNLDDKEQNDLLEDVDSSLTYKENGTSEELQNNVKTTLDKLVNNVNTLYANLLVLSDEYNEYAGATNIRLNSDIISYANVQILLYTIITAITIAFAFACGILIIARLGDIFNYNIYMDKKLMLPNRASCDRYLNKNEKNMLKNHFVCISILLSGLQAKNKEFGRNKCDEMIKSFAEYLQKIFPVLSEDNMIAVNGLGQFIIFLDGTTKEQAEAYIGYLNNKVQRFNYSTECKIEYKYGIAEAENENIFKIRDLMICAINKANKSGNMNDGENGSVYNSRYKVSGQNHNSQDKVVDLLQKLENIKRG